MKTHPTKPADPEKQARIAAELRRDRDQREHSYRSQALSILAHVCARCGREFSGKRLRELTVHHRDHNFRNNPPNGSNWELLCLYCHDHEHEKADTAGQYQADASNARQAPPSTFTPFAGLDALLKPANQRAPEQSPEGENGPS